MSNFEGVVMGPYLRSSFCSGGSCVEVACDPDSYAVWVRSSRNDQTAAIRFDCEEWSTFLTCVKADEFDA
jgi:hypothetical protein